MFATPLPVLAYHPCLCGWLWLGAAVEAGAGYADGTFGATRQITRSEIAVILQRVIRNGLVPVALAEGVTFTGAAAITDWAGDGLAVLSNSSATIAGNTAKYGDAILIVDSTISMDDNYSINLNTAITALRTSFTMRKGLSRPRLRW